MIRALAMAAAFLAGYAAHRFLTRPQSVAGIQVVRTPLGEVRVYSHGEKR